MSTNELPPPKTLIFAIVRLALVSPSEAFIHQVERLIEFYGDDKFALSLRQLLRNATDPGRHTFLKGHANRLVFSGFGESERAALASAQPSAGEAPETPAQSWDPRNLLRKLNALRRSSPVVVTCPASRHAQQVAEALLAGRSIEEPEHAASSILATVLNLWETRAATPSEPTPAAAGSAEAVAWQQSSRDELDGWGGWQYVSPGDLESIRRWVARDPANRRLRALYATPPTQTPAPREAKP